MPDEKATFDVFLSHNSRDKPAVREIAEALRDRRGLGARHSEVAVCLNNLAQLLQDTNRLPEAEPLMRRAVEIWRNSLGPEHPNTQIGQRNLAFLLQEIAAQSEPPSRPAGAEFE